MRVAFFGSSRFSTLVLEQLLNSAHHVACVVTQPDQPSGRSMTLTPTVVAALAAVTNLPILKPHKLRGDEECEADLRELELDALLVASYGQIIPKRILNVAPWPLNVHPSDLPKLRGASPIRTALLQGLEATACCIMRMTPRLDDGDVLLREEVQIPAEWNYEAAESALGELGGRMAVQALDACAAGASTLTPQDHSQATYCSTYTRAETWIDWKRPARELHNFVRAWDPDLGALTTFNGKRLKIWRTVETEGSGEPGTVIASDRRQFIVACGSNALSLLEVQPENKRLMAISEFLAGNKVEPGMHFSSVD